MAGEVGAYCERVHTIGQTDTRFIIPLKNKRNLPSSNCLIKILLSSWRDPDWSAAAASPSVLRGYHTGHVCLRWHEGCWFKPRMIGATASVVQDQLLPLNVERSKVTKTGLCNRGSNEHRLKILSIIALKCCG